MSQSVKIFLYAFTAISLTCLPSAFADNAQPTKVYVHRSYQHQDVDRKEHIYQPSLGRAGEIAISEQDRVLLGRYVNHAYKNTCPWEHSYRFKKCIAPIPQKKTYMIGYALPDDVTASDLPRPVTTRLRPIPAGYKYVLVGNDVLLINASTRDVIDAVTLLSAYAPQ